MAPLEVRELQVDDGRRGSPGALVHGLQRKSRTLSKHRGFNHRSPLTIQCYHCRGKPSSAAEPKYHNTDATVISHNLVIKTHFLRVRSLSCTFCIIIFSRSQAWEGRQTPDHLGVFRITSTYYVGIKRLYSSYIAYSFVETQSHLQVNHLNHS
jgi:hypothetical protein